MRISSLSLRILRVSAAVLATTYVGCATQEDTGSGPSELEDVVHAGGDAGGTSAGSSGVALGGRPSSTAGTSSGGTTTGANGSGGSSPSIAGSSADPGSNGGSAGTPSGGTSAAGDGGTSGSGGVSGGGSSAGTGTVQPDTTPPSTPGSLQTSAITTTSITLSWTASTDNVGVSGYRLYNGATQVTTTTATTHTFKNLNTGTAYTFGVEAFDAAANKSTRATKSATTTAPAACDNSGSAVAKLTHGQTYTVNGSACLELVVNPAWNPVDVLLEQTAGSGLTYTYKSCAKNGSGTIASVVHFFTGTNPNCNFYVQLGGNGTIAYYD
jgi:chitodextrinase